MKYMRCSEHGLYIPSKSIEKKDNGYGRWISESSARDNHRYCNDKKFQGQNEEKQAESSESKDVRKTERRRKPAVKL